jgi:hypothetical protein
LAFLPGQALPRSLPSRGPRLPGKAFRSLFEALFN